MIRPTTIKIEKLNSEFLEFKKTNLAESTYLGYRSIANTLNRHIGHLCVADITTYDLEQYLNETMLTAIKPNGEVGYNDKTRVNHASYLKRIFTYLYKRALINTNPCAEALEVVKKGTFVPEKPYSDEDIATIRRIANDDSDILGSYIALVFLFAISTGLRPSEIIPLTLSDLQQGKQSGTYVLHINKALAITQVKDTKTTKSNRVLQLPEPSVVYLKKILERNNTSFDFAVSSNSMELALIKDPMTNQAFINPGNLYDRSKSALKNKVASFRGIKPCRHTFATLCADNDLPFDDIASMMGHSDTDMLEKHYAYYREKHPVVGEKHLAKMNRIF
ncbi:TPA: tyrosine-type recombinase/integrase [Vibrio parahaemolyticus]|uniref:tyrosine-type recombinase/integrase n=1 Tax=Vibrio parahaemolyticus TaxID=670 RepID=UPI0010E4D1F6|nr:tyrosine-type recombinase/integrase [Vibrio parahaemolyticus]TBT43787.1 hypothetical protein D5E79_13205 [Vibrio parahaemolyticus]TOZ98939.1 hypothetical protein DXE04_03760 [Vibrio parahaemolyticus]HCH1564364.1 tyrosine-type recombinase/integrase [Vibrio parahaemolyticus]HCH2584750.1 tyrosine-type recombinase/integrase [Vibrio parahaemolyticus]HCH2588571.1 tyrosine-type recombinase/integrase [Vibrio parahaemolyticus]